jgi:hypothetical protein
MSGNVVDVGMRKVDMPVLNLEIFACEFTPEELGISDNSARYQIESNYTMMSNSEIVLGELFLAARGLLLAA